MKRALPPRPPQPFHLAILQSPPHNPLQLLPTNLLHRAILFIRLDPRLEPRLHADAQRTAEPQRGRVAADLHRPGGLRLPSVRGVSDGEERFLVAAVDLQRERTRDFRRGDNQEGFVV